MVYADFGTETTEDLSGPVFDTDETSVKFVVAAGKAIRSGGVDGYVASNEVQTIEVKSGADRVVEDVNALLVDPSGVIFDSVTAPASGDDVTYYLSFDMVFGDWTDIDTLSKGVVNNHIPMDPNDLATGLLVTKVADDSGISSPPAIGDVITYTITAANNGDLDLDSQLCAASGGCGCGS